MRGFLELPATDDSRGKLLRLNQIEAISFDDTKVSIYMIASPDPYETTLPIAEVSRRLARAIREGDIFDDPEDLEDEEDDPDFEPDFESDEDAEDEDDEAADEDEDEDDDVEDEDEDEDEDDDEDFDDESDLPGEPIRLSRRADPRTRARKPSPKLIPEEDPESVHDILVTCDEALELIHEHGGAESAEHKQWILDQVVRKLAADSYGAWVRRFNTVGGGGANWSEGLDPSGGEAP